MSQYRIEWKSSLTNINGHGEWFNEKDVALLKDNINYLNKKYKNELFHWLVKC